MVKEKVTPKPEAQQEAEKQAAAEVAAAQAQAAQAQADAQKKAEEQQKEMQKKAVKGMLWGALTGIVSKLLAKVMNKISLSLVLLVAVMSVGAQTHLGKGRFNIGAPDNYNYGYGSYTQLATSNIIYFAKTDSFAFAQNAWNYVGARNTEIGPNCAHAIDLFGWGSSGFLNSAKPWAYNLSDSQYAPYMKKGSEFSGCSTCGFVGPNSDLYEYMGYDWSSMYYIQGENGYATLTAGEWEYLLNKRKNAKLLKGFATVNNVKGLILVPDNWQVPYDIPFTPEMWNEDGYEGNIYTAEQWRWLEESGAIFLPAAGGRSYNASTSTVTYTGDNIGCYWTSSASETSDTQAQNVRFNGNVGAAYVADVPRSYGESVRLRNRYRVYNNYVKDIDETVYLQLDKNGKATWNVTGYTFTKPGVFYYTVLDAEKDGSDYIDHRYRFIVTDPYSTYHKVSIELVNIDKLTGSKWDSKRIAPYVDLGEQANKAVNDTIEVKHGTQFTIHFHSDFFRSYRFSAPGHTSNDFDSIYTHEITGDFKVILYVKARMLYVKGRPSEDGGYGKGYGQGGYMNDGSGELWPSPQIDLDDYPDKYPADKWNVRYVAKPATNGQFVGWVPELWLKEYGDEESALSVADYLKGYIEGQDGTDTKEYQLLKKFENEEFNVTVAEIYDFIELCGVTTLSDKFQYLIMHAVFEEKEETKYKVTVSGDHGNVYDKNGHSGGCVQIFSCKDKIFEYPAGTKLSLDINEIEDGYAFDYWKVDGYSAGTSLPLDYTITKDATIEAIFKEATPTTYTVFIESAHGTVYDRNGETLSTYMGDPCFYAEGTLSLDIKDIDTGWEFDHWEVDGTNVGSDLPYSLTPDQDYIVVKAVYQQAASDLDESYVCDFTTAASKHSAYNDSWTYDSDWTVYGGANNSGQWAYAKMGGKSGTLATVNPVYVVNKSAFDKEIKGVKIYYKSGSLGKSGMDVTSWGVKVYSDATCSTLVYTATSKDLITGDDEYFIVYPAEGQTWSAGNYIQVYWDLVNTTSTNGIIWVNKIAWLTKPVVTDIENVQSSAVRSQKIIRDGQLFIIRDGKSYNAQGAEVR